MYTANLTLDDRLLQAQSLDFEREDLTTSMSVDGFLSTGGSDTIVRWSEGSARELERVSHVHAVTIDGTVLLNGGLNRNITPPTDLQGGGVEFAVYEGA